MPRVKASHRERWLALRDRVKLGRIDPDTKHTRWRLSAGNLTAALGVFAVEVAIARYVHTGLVRTFAGDVLVVVLLYFLARSVIALPVGWTVFGGFLFACAIELGQALQLVRLLGLEHDRLARIVIGTAYDPTDFLAYALGAALLLAAHYFFMMRNRL